MFYISLCHIKDYDYQVLVFVGVEFTVILRTMNSYNITTTVRCALVSVKGVDIDGIRIITPNASKPHETLISTQIRADTWKNALDIFRPKIMKLLDAITLGVGIAATWYESNYFIEKEGSDIYLVFIHTNKAESRFSLTKDRRADIEKLYHSLTSGNVLYTSLRHAVSTKDGKTGLMLSLFSSEDVAGRLQSPESPNYEVTNRAELKRIISRELHDKFYSARRALGGRSVRTALAHGYEYNPSDDELGHARDVLLRTINEIRHRHNLEHELTEIHGFDIYGEGGYSFTIANLKINPYRLVSLIVTSDFMSIEAEGYSLTDLPQDY